MIFRTYAPQPPLSEFVSLLWYQEGYAPPHARERVLPTGTVELVIDLRDEALRVYDRQWHDRFQSFPGTLICGPHSKFFVIDSAQPSAVIGVHFKPGGALPFLKLPASELHDEHVSLDELWGAAAAELRDRLLEARTPEARFRILELSLLAQGAQSLTRHPAIAFALKEFHRVPHTRTIADVTEQIGLSHRRFIQLFSDEVGLTPKLFCRVRRFQQVLGLIERHQRVVWSEVALACGYYDQAHFIHDFRAFSDLTPTAYLADRFQRLNHVPLRG